MHGLFACHPAVDPRQGYDGQRLVDVLRVLVHPCADERTLGDSLVAKLVGDRDFEHRKYTLFIVVLRGTCALLSTLGIVFDRVVFRFRALASSFHAVALFGCLNLVVPALFPNTRTLYSLLIAMGITVVGFWANHMNLAMLRDRRWIALFLMTGAGALGAAYAGRTAIPRA